jgi:uncharacterized protein (DUF58 family)
MSRGLDRAARELVDPQLFATLEDLELVARTAVEGFLQGLHRSPYVGFSVEFASHREYLPGDDLRHLNWKLFGRQDRLYVKQYDAETNLDLHLLVDWSGSMTTHSGGRLSKQRYAACLAAALAHLALRQRDAVGLTLFSSSVLDHLKPRAKANQLDEVLHALTRTPLHPHAESAKVLHEIAELMPRRGLVVLISDLFYDAAELFAGLDHFRYQGHDILLFQLLDPLERWLPVEGSVRFHDLETGEEVVTEADAIRPAYQAAVGVWLQELEQGCRTRELERVELTTDQPLARALSDYLERRAEHF